MTGDNCKYLKKDLSQCQFIHQKSHMERPEIQREPTVTANVDIECFPYERLKHFICHVDMVQNLCLHFLILLLAFCYL